MSEEVVVGDLIFAGRDGFLKKGDSSPVDLPDGTVIQFEDGVCFKSVGRVMSSWSDLMGHDWHIVVRKKDCAVMVELPPEGGSGLIFVRYIDDSTARVVSLPGA